MEKQISEYIYKSDRSKTGKTIFNRRKTGFLTAFINPENPDNVVIGYSMCHSKFDEYDYLPVNDCTVIRTEGHGKNMAEKRAIKWAGENELVVAFSVRKKLDKFIARCKKYYKDKQFPAWIDNIKVPELYEEPF